MKNFWNRDL